MSSKNKSHPLNGPHTAGIFADMTVDGPVIGTLVAIVDRAKNLPNRKTIGKQDPYCAARLGKEAKKTATDIRGGQTPKWDQELRFTVHDTPDYYQLKVSVFTDDKKTDLVGEAWIDLRNIILTGGGQGDVWQNLTCRGKYAGEIRLEITFYDSRPKPEKPVANKIRQPAAVEPDNNAPPQQQQRTPMKRRPLPADPVTGEAPVTPPVAQPAAPPRASPGPDHYQTPPRAHGKPISHSGYVPKQSPLQGLEYQTPPSASRHQYQENYGSPVQGQRQQAPRGDHPRQMPRQAETPPRNYDERDYNARQSVSPYQQLDRRSLPMPDPYDVGPEPDDARPPPPPAHRTVPSSGAYDAQPQRQASQMPMRHDVLMNEAHRYSSPSYPGRPGFRGYDSAPAVTEGLHGHGEPAYEPAALRHHQSYDGGYDGYQGRSMQPTVEDVPESPPGQFSSSFGRGEQPRPMYNDAGYNDAGYNDRGYNDAGYNQGRSSFSRQRSPGPAHHGTPSPIPSPGNYDGPGGYQTSPTHQRSRDFSTSPGHRPYQGPEFGIEEEIHMQSSAPGLPALPPSLVPGMDPRLSQELSERIIEERRADRRYSDQNAVVVRGRQMVDTPPSYNTGSRYDRRSSGITYSGAPESSMVSHRGASPNPMPRGVSPIPDTNPRHMIPRKSVSPIPPPLESRRESDVPFGPDSFDAFNTSMISVREEQREAEAADKIITYDGKEIDPSDHLPIESWAPEPEPKQSQAPESRGRLSGAQPMPSSGRRQLRIAARPQQAPPAPRPSFGPQDPHTPPPPSSGRNRLHKKSHRASYGPAASGSSPLAPISPDNYQDRQSPYSSQSHHRNGQWDYANENHAPHYGSAAPPIPAKVPLAIMSGANGGGDDMAMLAEMQRIDIGTGRSRRRGGY